MKLKKCTFPAIFLCTGLFSGVWAQADLQPLATIKLQKSESITVRQLKTRAEMYQKQTGASSFTIDQKKEILDAMIDEKLVVQAALRGGINVTDAQVNQYFIQNISQQMGRAVTEQEFATYIKQGTGKTLDEYIRDETGLNVVEFKSHLKNQLIAQQYLLQQNQAALQQQTPSDKEIRDYYANNQTQFAQSETLKLFLVVAQKGSDAQAVRKRITDIYGDVKSKKVSDDDLKKKYQATTSGAAPELGAADIFVSRTPQAMQQLHVTAEQLRELFGRENGFLSEIVETPTDFQFYVVRGRYPAKLLALSDSVQPESTTTVYEYLKAYLGQEKQARFMVEAIKDITAKLRIPENFSMVKTGAALDALLNW